MQMLFYVCACLTNTILLTLQGVDYCGKGHQCHNNASCLNLETTYACHCDAGFSGDGHTCYGKMFILLLKFLLNYYRDYLLQHLSKLARKRVFERRALAISVCKKRIWYRGYLLWSEQMVCKKL